MEDKTHRAREERGNGERFLRNGRLLALSAVNIAQAVVSSLVGFFLIPYLKGKGMDLAITGSVVAAYNLVSGVIQLPMGRFSDRADKFRIAWISGAGTAAVLLLFPISKGIWAFGTAAVLTSVGSAALLSSTSALAVEVGRETGMGGTMGFLSTSNSVGMILGCISLSLMPGTGLGYGAFFYLSSGAVLVCTALFAFLWTVNSNKVRRRRE